LPIGPFTLCGAGDRRRFMKYEEFVPEGTPQQFLDRLAAFFEDKGARLPPRARVAQNAALNLSQLFRLVAQRGGYQAVTANWSVGALAKLTFLFVAHRAALPNQKPSTLNLNPWQQTKSCSCCLVRLCD
jgi:hypothetical protein